MVLSLVNHGTDASLRSQNASMDQENNNLNSDVTTQIKQSSRKTGLVTPMDELGPPRMLFNSGRAQGQIKIYQSNNDMLQKALIIDKKKNSNPTIEEFTHSTSYEEVEVLNTRYYAPLGQPKSKQDLENSQFYMSTNIEPKREQIIDLKEFR